MTPRKTFVEAMRRLRFLSGSLAQKDIRAACEAFADQDCDVHDMIARCFVKATVGFKHGKSDKFVAMLEKEHEVCRAALLKEVFDD